MSNEPKLSVIVQNIYQVILKIVKVVKVKGRPTSSRLKKTNVTTKYPVWFWTRSFCYKRHYWDKIKHCILVVISLYFPSSWKVLHSFLDIHDSHLWRLYQLFCRMILSVRFFWYFLIMRFGLCDFGKNITKWISHQVVSVIDLSHYQWS